MGRPDNFHVLAERLRVTGTLETRTGLRIGTGGAGPMDLMDLPVLRDAEELPFIPGASLKGVMRSTLEALVRAAEDRPRGLWSCDPLAERGEGRGCGHYDAKDAQGRKVSRDDVPVDGHCALCCLFGSQLLASHVRFSDALLLDRNGPAPVSLRDGVAIDRDLRIVHGAQKYDFEVVNPGARFRLELFVDNPEPWLMGLLVVGLDQIAEGFTAVGGFTSRGLGRVEVRLEHLWRVRAESVLRGEHPEVIEGAALEAQLTEWRDALATRVGGEA
jgi:CRISPR-associated RAMP protein (TIGR02581 family)